MITTQGLEHFFNQYENIIKTGLEYDYSEQEIYDTIYSKEFNNYLRKGYEPKIEELNHVVNFVREFRGGELDYDVKSQSNYYRWNSENDACERCNELDGQIFDYLPERPHPHCNCEIEEILLEEYNNIKGIHKEDLQKRDNTVNYLDELIKLDIDGNPKSETHPTDNCATYVRIAIEENTDLKIGKHGPAYNYKKPLENVGFKPVTLYTHNDKDIDQNRITGELPKSYKIQKGDVVIFDASPGHKDGHIAMFNGKQWVSDFKQRDMWGGSARQYAPSYAIYRLPRWNVWELDKDN